MWKRFLATTGIVVALTAGASATAALLAVSTIASNVFPRSSQIAHQALGDTITPAEAGSPETIMIIGSDKRALAKSVDSSGPPHSDTLMLVHMDPDQGLTSVLSIPRDLKVLINGQTQKVNAAFTIGGPKLTLRTVRNLLRIPINHVVIVNFKGFRRAVDAVGCVFVDVDRRYYNPQGTGYASIDIKPGYQRLCGQNALDYVRYRHTDSDFVRVARQQDFIRQFKEQVGAQGLIDHAADLERAIGRSIQTDIHGTSDTLTLTKLVAFSLSRPVRQVHFQATAGPSYVTATAYDLEQTAREFLNAGAGQGHPHVTVPRTPRRGHHRRAAAPTGGGLVALPRGASDQAVSASIGWPLPILFPRREPAASGIPQTFRRYTLHDEKGHPHHAYRIVFSRGFVGEYWGVEGTDWTSPPILAHPSSPIHAGGRTYLPVYDGTHLAVLAWRTPRAVYWVANTLLRSIPNAQMLALANATQTAG